MISWTVKVTILICLINQTLTSKIDLTLRENATGKSVVDAIARKLIQSNIFKDDTDFTRRVAWVETKFGEDYTTFRDEYFGGIWQVDKHIYERTQDISRYPVLLGLHAKIFEAFEIQWNQTTWESLRIPLHSALAFRIYFDALDSPNIPSTIVDQSYYWKYYNTNTSATPDHFIFKVRELEVEFYCSPARMDISAILYCPAGIEPENFEIMKEFFARLVLSYDINPEGQGTKLGLVEYSDTAQVVFPVENNLSASEMQKLIHERDYSFGETNTPAGILTAVDLLKNSTKRKSVPLVMILLTDRNSNLGDLTAAMDAVRQNDIIPFAIGINVENTGPLGPELLEIALRDPSRTFMIGVFGALREFVRRMSEETCKLPRKPKLNEITFDTIYQRQTHYHEFNLADGSGISVHVGSQTGQTRTFYSINQNISSEAVNDGDLEGVGWFSVSYSYCSDLQSFEQVKNNCFVLIALEGHSDVDEYTLEIIEFIETTTPFSTESTMATTPPCSSGKFCDKTDSYNVYWKACAGTLAWNNCPKNRTGLAKWFCMTNGKFEEQTPDFTNCSSGWFDEIRDQIEEGVPIPPTRAQMLLDKIIHNSESMGYFGHEIVEIFDITGRLLELVSYKASINEFEELTNTGWNILGNILTTTEPWNEIPFRNRPKVSNVFISTLEMASLELAERVTRNSTFQSYELKYRRTFQGFSEFNVLAGAQLKNRKEELSYPDEYSSQDSHIDLPTDWEDYLINENVTLVGIQVKPQYANFLFPGQLNKLGPDEAPSKGKIINGNIMGFSFGEQFEDFIEKMEVLLHGINFTTGGVRITFQHDLLAWGDGVKDVRRSLHDGEKQTVAIGTSACVYWDTVNLFWSTDGCRRVSSSRSETICECDHLTSFALLMDVHNYIGKDLALELLTLILCPLSIMCLIICIYIITMIGSEKSLRTDLTRNLCICLLIGNIFMILFTDKHYLWLSDEVCVASSVAVHYIFLCAIMWMGVEGVLMYKTIFLDVFVKGENYLLVQYILAYGIPGLIVGATGLTTAVRSDNGYGNDSFCWLNGDYIWAFLGPTALILAVNLFVLTASLRKAYKRQTNSNPAIRATGNVSVKWMKGSFQISILLGLTWISGYFMVIDNSIIARVSAYLFTILNASQGIFLFIVHGIMNPKVRSALKKRIRVSFSSNSGTHLTPATTEIPNYKYKYPRRF